MDKHNPDMNNASSPLANTAKKSVFTFKLLRGEASSKPRNSTSDYSTPVVNSQKKSRVGPIYKTSIQWKVERSSNGGGLGKEHFFGKLLAEGYTREELGEYNQVFSMFDTDGSGSIGIDELANAMKSMGMKATDMEVGHLIQEVDQDGNGEIDFEEFCDVMKRMSVKGKPSWDDVVKQCFVVFDRSGSGTINDEDFRMILKDLGEIRDDRLIDSIFSEFDVDGNHAIDYEEFTNMVKHYMKEEDIENYGNKK